MAINEQKPYTYLICCIPENKFYYGVQYGKTANPHKLWKTYFTSSKIIKSLVKKYGKENFYYQIRKIFNNSKDAYNWEQKVLKRLKVEYNKKMLNFKWNGPASEFRKNGRKPKEFIPKPQEKRFSDLFSDFLLNLSNLQ